MIRYTTFPHFMKVAQFDKLDKMKSSSRIGINKIREEWKELIGFYDLSAKSQNFLQEITDFGLDTVWDYSEKMKSWLSKSRAGEEIEELKILCKDGQSTKDFLIAKRKELNGEYGVGSVYSTIIEPVNDYAPWVTFQNRFDYDGVIDYISNEEMYEFMGECAHELEMVQKQRELKQWLSEKIAKGRRFVEEKGLADKLEFEPKGYVIGAGYMGWNGEKYQLFATEGEYNEWISDDSYSADEIEI